ncbi:sensor domain-containing diguanylate cyclase [Qipengyuania spongiae]|uniref:diguanylate cyclase n=1 Tax=Qipengyuania spongiae TaxID=2909673 RepID=A0ABY5T0U6_9SPHN|nr:sensor domain-containing diguanylate cyclase [Qipengyuania spongiae]UVI39129.1 diguanylate cyclase [Qipengyuania spongiae]
MIGLIYFALAALSVLYSRFEGGPAFLWTATGVALGVTLGTDRRRWTEKLVACGIASFFATSLFSLGPVAGFLLAFVNVAEIVVGVVLLQYMRPAFGSLRSSGEIVALISLAGVAAPAITGLGGAAVIAAHTPTAFWPNWAIWVSGHALGTTLICPFVILLLRGEYGHWWRESPTGAKVEAASIILAMSLVAVVVFLWSSQPLLVLPFPLMMAAVFRHGRVGATFSILVLAIISVTFTVAGSGPIGTLAENDATRSILIQLYLASAVLTVLPAAGNLGQIEGKLSHFQQQSALYRLILDRSGDLIMTFDMQSVIRFASPASIEVLGLSPDMLIGTRPQPLIHPDDLERVMAVHFEVVADPSRTRTVDYRVCLDGRMIGWFETHAQATVDELGRATGTVCVIRNVSERKRLENALSSAARTDPLTGLANRRAFDETMEARMKGGKAAGPSTLVLFDLDHFKSVNDNYGHAAGDQVLKVFADVLRGELRTRDLAARIGGEEFVVVIDGDIDVARHVCERIRLAMCHTAVTLDTGKRISATVSGGLCPLDRTVSLLNAFQHADAALYQAKRSGRNRCEIARPQAAAPFDRFEAA